MGKTKQNTMLLKRDRELVDIIVHAIWALTDRHKVYLLTMLLILSNVLWLVITNS